MDSFVENPTSEVENNLLKALESNFRLYEIEIQELSLVCLILDSHKMSGLSWMIPYRIILLRLNIPLKSLL